MGEGNEIQIQREQYAEIKGARRSNKDKRVEKRLEVLQLRCEGKSQQEIADKTDFHRSYVCKLIPDNIRLFFIPPYTPEMNPIEQIWKEIRKRGFRNEIFATLDKVVNRLCDTICDLSAQVVRSITARGWILSCFN